MEQEKGAWRVWVYGADMASPLGELVYGITGELLTDRSTPFAEMRHKALERVQ